MKLTQEKIQQAISALAENGIDVWLTFVRETSASGDPVIPLIYGYDLTWHSAILISAQGDTIAILGHYEAETARTIGAFQQVIPYHESIRPALIEQLEKLDPEQIAINYSLNDVLADGLSHGLYLQLIKYLEGTPYAGRLVSAEKVIAALRGRKTPGELARIRAAIDATEAIYTATFAHIRPGMTERQVADFMQAELRRRNLAPAWDLAHCPIVNTGPDSVPGHVAPTDRRIEPGHLVHIDFGIQKDEYCSDIQRMAYVLRSGESKPPEPVQHGFDTVLGAIQAAMATMKPGVTGKEVDAAARQHITEAGYPEFKFATGHQLGRLAHDGAGLLGPEWERYGDTPNYRLEPGQVYTVEPGLSVSEYGWLGLEEDVVVTERGTEYLSTPQTEIVLITSR